MSIGRLAPLLLVCACAQASTNAGGGGGGGGDASNSQQDGNTQQQFFDAPGPRDAMVLGPDSAISEDLSETGNQTMTYGDSIACSNNNTGDTYDNTWYRAFQLSDYPDISGGYHISGVNIGVQEASSAGTVTVNIESYAGALDGSTIDLTGSTLLGTGTVNPPNTSGQTGETVTANVAADIPAGGKFVVEVVAPDTDTSGYFYIGGTSSAETHDGYISSVGCMDTTPENTTTAGETGSLIIEVVGTH